MINSLLKSDVLYRKIYDRQISLKEFETWLKQKLQQAYDKGLNDASATNSYEDISKSAYD